MASFKERYEELFGDTPDYDPIKIAERPKRRALDIQSAAPSASPKQQAIPYRPSPTPRPEEQGILGNIGDLTKTGTAMLGEAVVGGVEYGARQLARNEIAGVRKVFGGAAEGLEDARGFLSDYRQRVYDSMPQDAVQKKGAEFLTLDPDKTIWKGNPLDVGEAILYKFWESVPMMAATLIPGAVMMRAGNAAKGITYLGASEGALSVGFIANEITDGIQEMDDETLTQESPRFAELLGTMDSPEAARNQLIAEAQGMAPVIGGILVGAISATAGRYLEPVITGKAGLSFGGRAGRGAVSEGLVQEGPQESVEQITSNIARAVYDGDLSALDGVLEAYVQGAVVGAPGGALVAGIGGRGAEPPVPGEPEQRDRPGAPSSFRDVFGEQVPPPGGYTGAAGPLIPEAEDVAEDVAAAVTAAIRGDVVMDDMVDNIQTATPEAQAQGNLPLQGGGMNTQARDVVPAGPVTTAQQIPPGQQGELPLEQRQRGEGRAPVPGTGQPQVAPQPEQAPVVGVAPTGAQGELFEQPQGEPDQPSAEPLGDIQAQLQDMADEASTREGVWLSADNVARLQRDGLMEQVEGKFVGLENFDGKGGILLVRDEEVAQGALDMKELGMPMQSILGQLTLAGAGKPPAEGSAVVQLRDEQGNVIRESLLPEDEAYAQADALGDMGVVLTPEQAQKRRQQLIEAELVDVEAASEAVRQQEIIREELPMEERGLAEPFAGEGVRKPATRAAAGVLGAGAKQAAQEKQKAIGGFFPPDTMEFDNEPLGEQYTETFGKLVENQLQQETAGTYPIERPAALKKEEARLFKELGRIRQAAKPKRKVTRVLKTAAKIDRRTVETQRRELSKKGTEIDINDRDYYASDGFTSRTREQIDALSPPNKMTAALVDAFGEASYWLSGQYRDLEMVPEWLGDRPVEADAAKKWDRDVQAWRKEQREINEYASGSAGDSFQKIVNQFTTPGQMRKLIRRVNVYYSKTSKVGSKPVVIKGKKTTVKTDVLTREQVKQDESRSDEIKRKQQSSVARKTLGVAVRQSNKLIQRLESARSVFGKALAEQDADTGAETKFASELRVAKAYFVALNQFAVSLIESGVQSNDINLVMEQLNSRLREITRLSPKQFATQVTRMARADEKAGLRWISDPKVRDQVSDPAKRITSIDGYYQNLLHTLSQRARMEDVWKKNSFYNNLVGPLMKKFIDSISVDGWASYKPNEAEMMYLEHAMHGWRTGGDRTRKELYDPLKRFFRGIGVEFKAEKKKGAGGDVIIPKNKDGKYEWRSNFEALEKKLRQTIGTETQATFESAPISTAQINVTREDIVLHGERQEVVGTRTQAEQREMDAQRRDREADAQEAALVLDVNRAIGAFLKIVNNGKSTIDKLVKAEQRFIARMKDLGVWEDTPSKALGKIRVGTVRTYRKIGLPLLAKKISKQDARASMSKMRPYPQPKEQRPKFTLTQAEKELNLKLGVIDPTGNAPELSATAAAVGDLITDRTANTSIDTVLTEMLKHLPENHIYRVLATKLKSLELTDVPVKYDFTGNLGSEFGAFKVISDKFGSSRVILINNRRLIQERGEGNVIDARVIHVILHEMVHAATYQALRSNTGLKNTLLRLREEVMLAADLANLPYGLTEVMNAEGDVLADEFVAEAMSNPKFQEMLKKVILDGKSAWVRFLDFVRNVLGFGEAAPVSALDIIISLESQLFAGAAQTSDAGTFTLKMDGAVSPYVSNVLDKLNSNTGTLKRIWDRATKAPLMAMTMEQIRDTYGTNFGGAQGGLRHYMQSFFQRNAMNTRLMEDAEKLTRRWTKLNEEAGTEGEEFSELATEATMQGIAADKPLSDPANSHVTADAQKVIHKTLHTRFKKMTPGYQQLYGDLQKFYRETLDREVGLMTLNALRGLLTKGDAVMTKKEFEAKYSAEKLKAFDTAEKFNAEFGQYFDSNSRAEMLATLNQMANVRAQRKGNYFPLKRYGDYVVFAEKQIERKVFSDNKEAYAYAAERRATDVTLTVSVRKDDNGTFIVGVTEKDFRTAETPTRAAEMREEMVELYGDDVVSPVQKKDKRSADAVISSNQALGSILKSLSGNTAAQAAIKNFYLEALSDSSFRKHEMRRKNRRGVETNLQLRNFTVYAKQSSYYTAQLAFGHKMAESLAEMSSYIREHRDESDITAVRLGEVYEEIKKRDEMQADPDEIMKLVKGTVEFTQFMMLTSPSYWMINASQPWMVTLPWLTSKYGLGASLSSLKNAQGLIISPLVKAMRDSKGGLSALRSKVKAEKAFNVLDDVIETIQKRDPDNADAYVSMLEELRQNNVIDLSWIAELRDISEGTDTGLKQKVLDASRIMAHLTEVNNRILTAIATYDLAKQEAIDNPSMFPESYHEYAVSQAQKAVSETQFNYSSPNKPRLFQPGGPMGKFGPAMFQFMQWPQHMYAMMIKNFHQSVKGGTEAERKEARKLLYGLFTTHLAAGGILGAALQPVKWAIGLTLMAFGDDDDTLRGAVSGESFDRAVTQLTTELFGSEIGGVLAKGLPTAVGADLSQRMSLGTVYYLDFKSENAESALGSLALGLGGASLNMTMNMWRGMNDMLDGNYVRGIERASPKILRDVIRTGRYWNEGLVNAAGDTVISAEGVSPRDLLLQSLGIQPYQVSQFYAGQQAIKDTERYYRERKSDILRGFRVAKTSAERAQILRDVAEFNRNNPAIAITRSALIQSVRAKAEREARFRRYGANIDEKAAQQFASEASPYR